VQVLQAARRGGLQGAVRPGQRLGQPVAHGPGRHRQALPGRHLQGGDDHTALGQGEGELADQSVPVAAGGGVPPRHRSERLAHALQFGGGVAGPGAAGVQAAVGVEGARLVVEAQVLVAGADLQNGPAQVIGAVRPRLPEVLGQQQQRAADVGQAALPDGPHGQHVAEGEQPVPDEHRVGRQPREAPGDVGDRPVGVLSPPRGQVAVAVGEAALEQDGGGLGAVGIEPPQGVVRGPDGVAERLRPQYAGHHALEEPLGVQAAGGGRELRVDPRVRPPRHLPQQAEGGVQLGPRVATEAAVFDAALQRQLALVEHQHGNEGVGGVQLRP